MLYVDLPAKRDLQSLALTRSDACVSIYLATTPVSQNIERSRINLANLIKAAIVQLDQKGFDKRRAAMLREQLDDLLDDDEFWRHQAHSLAILATPDSIRTWRLANRLVDLFEVADRFHLKPLLRAIAFPHSAYVLALSENAVRLVEVSPDIPAADVHVPRLPKDAASAVGKSTINDRSPSGRVHGSEGQKVRLAQFVRQIDAALRPILAASDAPLILAAAEPLASLFRTVSTLHVINGTIGGSPDRTTNAELASAARPVLDAAYAREIENLKKLFEQRAGQRRTTTDVSDAARAATFGGIDTILVDMDTLVPGTVDEATGAVTFAAENDAAAYGVVDEIALRAMLSGARVMAVRKDDIPGGKELAAILRSPI
ncbi:hypothetical protein [Bradyrhizobium sp. LHD-71]|uniref:baeRF11 domain-containing protein n=1 Tax=Bradyrhizobium sp. LHD-71 TaxID=3072141 RepID=UPI0028107DF8|nr:hypothetical protein [Bradyrhizobium sp. LHD-71]MDQ8729986.1 hypothetical protein [Bradyrhizobium sp. LHD-71]